MSFFGSFNLKTRLILNNKYAILLLFLANTISGFSQGISLIAIPWYFVDVLEQPQLNSYIYFVATIVSLFWGTYAGTLVDKHSRKKIFLWSNIVGAGLFLSGGFFCYYTQTVPIFILGLLFSCTFFIFNIHYPTLYAFAQELVEQKDYGRITSYIEVQGQTTSVISGGIAAILLSGGVYNIGFQTIEVSKWSMSQILLLDGFTYLTCIFIILLIKYESTVRRKIEEQNIFERLQTGLNFFKTNPLILLFGVSSFSVFATVLVGNFVLAPDYVRNYLEADANVYALHELMYAFGAICAGLFVSRIFSKWNNILGCILLHILCGVVYFIFAFIWNIPVFLSFMFFIGLCNAGSRVLRITFLLERVPNQVIGRVGSVYMVINVIERLILIALFTTPLFAKNIAFSYVVCGGFCWMAAVVMIVFYQKMVAIPKQ